MYNPLRLNDTLHPDAGNGPDDTLKAKQVLEQLGYYEVPDYDMTPYPDFAMFDAIRNFQRDIGLSDDGVIKPYSQTETLINEVLSYSMRDGAKPSAGGPGGPGGQVHVKAYEQHGGDTLVQVTDHTRAAPGGGGGGDLKEKISDKPLPAHKDAVANPRIRGKDGYKSGAFLEERVDKNGKVTQHMGVDVVTEPGEPVVSPVSGTYKRKLDPYDGKSKQGLYGGIEIEADNGDMVQIMYIGPDANLKRGQRVVAGETPIGAAQDITPSYPPKKEGVMTNHIHVEVEDWSGSTKKFKDPTPMFMPDNRQ